MQRLTLARPDDWHLHLRDGAALAAVLPHTVARFGRALVMPNLKPPVTDVSAALAYRDRILACLPAGADFQPLMALYLTEATPLTVIQEAAAHPAVLSMKYYPAGATTNAEHGVRSLAHVYPLLEAMERLGLPLCVHGEDIGPDTDVFDRERFFIERELEPALRRFPGMRVVFEHITTAEAAQFVMEAAPSVAASLTPQHLLYSRNALFQGGLRPHFYCLPVLKRERHRQALVAAAISGSPKFFLGTDSAPHARDAKESGCGCAGIYSAHAGIELYAEVFEQAGALHRLEAFASHHGADFYGLPRNAGRISLVKAPWEPPVDYAFGEAARLVPLRAGQKIGWRLTD
jgi:dihydroorotase